MNRLFVSFVVAFFAGCGPSETMVLSPATGGSGGAAGQGGVSAGGQTGSQGGVGGAGGAGGASGGSGGSVAARSCKRGVAYGHHSPEDLAITAQGTAWWYNWSPGPDDASVAAVYEKLGVEFVPMIWGEADLKPERVAMIPASAKHLLGFNEPNFKKNQANLSPEQAAALWPQVQKIAEDRGLSLVSPALNYCGPAEDCWTTDPFSWFDAFFAACKDCKVDAIAVHWYACKKEYLSDYLGQMKKYQKPIWLTEFSCLDDDGLKGDPANQAAYLKDALELLENEPSIERYSWFTGRYDAVPAINLYGQSGQLTPLGTQYTQTPGSCTP